MCSGIDSLRNRKMLLLAFCPYPCLFSASAVSRVPQEKAEVGEKKGIEGECIRHPGACVSAKTQQCPSLFKEDTPGSEHLPAQQMIPNGNMHLFECGHITVLDGKGSQWVMCLQISTSRWQILMSPGGDLKVNQARRGTFPTQCK